MSRYAESALALACVCAAVFTGQWLDGAYQNELGGYSDEAAHYVTGRMVADYVTTSFGRNPLEFAAEYYVRYPKVALGHWPPLFYVVMAGWTITFGATYGSVLVLVAVITSLFAFTVGRMVRQDYGFAVALAAGILCVVFPFVHATTACVMVDPLVALLSTWAILAYGRYLDRPQMGSAVAFGFLASAAILTKGNAAALGLMVPLAVALGGRWSLLKRLSFWLPAIIVAATCAPWYVATRKLARGALLPLDLAPGWLLNALAAPIYEGVKAFGLPVTILAAVGLLLTLVRRRRADGMRLALAAFLPAFVLLHALVVPGIRESRYLISLVPAAVVFLLDGTHSVLLRAHVAKVGMVQKRGLAPSQTSVSTRKTRLGEVPVPVFEPKVLQYARAEICLLLIALAVFLGVAFDYPSKACRGYGDVVKFLLASPELRKRPILICSDPNGEGMFVAETLVQDSGRTCLVFRASKVLASEPWIGGGYVSQVQTAEETLALLKRLKVGAVVVDTSMPEYHRRLHDRLLTDSLRSNSSEYQLLRSTAVVRRKERFQDGLRVYAARNLAEDWSSEIQIDMRYSLGKAIEARIGPAGIEVRRRPGPLGY